MNYEEMLDRAKEILPEEAEDTGRFEIPKVKGHVEGSKTVINNWQEVSKAISRRPEHLLKYVQKEMATPGEIIKDSVVFGSKLSAKKMNEKIEQYTDEFVICPTCGKPDTKLSKEGGIYFIKCQACGSKNAVRSRI